MTAFVHGISPPGCWVCPRATQVYLWALPAPKDADFSLYVRAYWPKAAITDGSWTPPPVERGS